MDDCLFCRIIKGELPAKIAYQDDLVTAFHDIDGEWRNRLPMNIHHQAAQT